MNGKNSPEGSIFMGSEISEDKKSRRPEHREEPRLTDSGFVL